MGYSKRLGRWIFIFFIGIILYFWGEDVGSGLKEIGEGLYILFEKWVRTPFGKFFSWVATPFREDWGIPKITQDPILQFIFGVFFFIVVIIPHLLITLFFGIVWLILFLITFFFALIRAVGVGIIEAFPRIKDFSLTGYILSVSVLAYISGRFFHSTIFPWLCQWGETILALTIGEFRYYLRRGERIKSMKHSFQKNKEKKKGELIKMEDKNKDIQYDIILIKKESPELLEGIPPSVFEEKGFLEEIHQRFKIRQKEKTLKAVISYIGTSAEIWERLLKAYRAKKELAIEKMRTGLQFEMVDLEKEVELLKLEKEKAQLEREIENIKYGKRFSDRFLQSVEDKINELKAKGVGIEKMSKERDKALSEIDREKYPELYQIIKHKWDDEIFRLHERE